jgi:hypothetical protein
MLDSIAWAKIIFPPITMNLPRHSAKLFLILPVICILTGFSVTPLNAADTGLSQLEQRVTRIEALQQPA